MFPAPVWPLSNPKTKLPVPVIFPDPEGTAWTSPGPFRGFGSGRALTIDTGCNFLAVPCGTGPAGMVFTTVVFSVGPILGTSALLTTTY